MQKAIDQTFIAQQAAGKGAGSNDASKKELIQFNIEGVSCRYTGDLSAYWDKLRSDQNKFRDMPVVPERRTLISSVKRRAAPPDSVKMAVPFAYGFLLTSAIASSMLLARRTTSTGPKIPSL